jgi:hypothetical protein
MVAGSGSSIVACTAANLAFFAVTQLLEGVPIATFSLFVPNRPPPAPSAA